MSRAELLSAKISLKNALYEIDRALKEEENGQTVENSR